MPLRISIHVGGGGGIGSPMFQVEEALLEEEEEGGSYLGGYMVLPDFNNPVYFFLPLQ